MGIFKSLSSVFQALFGIFRSSPATEIVTAPAVPAVEQTAIAVPAVAGFVYRDTSATHADFYLAARLASVAKLNTPNGRKPSGQKSRFAGLPPMPSERLGAKRTQLDAGKGLRVLAAKPQTRKSGIVIPFPLEKRRAAEIDAQDMAEAA